MAPPPIPATATAEFLREYRRAIARGCLPMGEQVSTGKRSALTEAADALGLSRNQARVRLSALDREQPGWRTGAVKSDVVAPELPSSHEPFDDLIERRIAASKRKLEAAAAREWMRFEVKEAAPFCLVFVGDPHADDDGCDLERLRDDLALIEATPGMHGIGMGDWTNNWSGRLSRLYAEQGTSAGEAWRFAEWMLSKPIWMLLLMGNHDMWSGSGSPLRWIAKEGRAPLVDWSCRFRVACGGSEWRINAAHDFPGSSMWNRLHAPLRRAKMGGHDADLYIAAHRHCFALAQEQDEHSGRVAWLARCKGYKASDSHATVLGSGQAQDLGQSIAAVCDPATGRMQCFADMREAAAYLTWLRRPRVRVRAGT
jgi:hypothetical protein